MKYADIKTVDLLGLNLKRLMVEVHDKDYVEVPECGLSASQNGNVLCLSQKAGCYSEAAALPGFDQSKQRVGSQTNIAGPVNGLIITGVVIGELNIKGDVLGTDFWRFWN
ncbi:MAG TPA: hypothetical protein PKZ02_02260 [Candidatus Paceibacterota bacterium]|nr:hypothetical protein [Candidatus Paceibacterota bacterium]HRZ51529.1 hypothetical protein [Candidatus Paceibacterota bacterium]HSA37246.1 hypothetical protein [Candidatus Paceibacterota bacterium]